MDPVAEWQSLFLYRDSVDWLGEDIKRFLTETPQRRPRRQMEETEDPFAADLDWNGERNCWRKLANAVIIQAVLDWREAAEKLALDPFDAEALEMKEDAETFFLSEDFALFTKMSGEELLRRLEEEQEHDDKGISLPGPAV